jgi:hypothetical protein
VIDLYEVSIGKIGNSIENDIISFSFQPIMLDDFVDA